MTKMRPILFVVLPLLGVGVGITGTLLLRGKKPEASVPAKESGSPSHEGTATQPDEGPEHVELPIEIVTQAGITTVAVVATTLRPELAVLGQLEYAPDASFVVRAPIAGTLLATANGAWPTVGATITKDLLVGKVAPRLQPVERADLEQRLLAAELELTTAESTANAAATALKRVTTLNANDKSASDREVEDATVRAATEQARLATAKRAQTQLQGLLHGELGTLPLLAAAGGEVVEQLATAGEAVEAGQPLLRITDRHRLVARVRPPLGHAFDAAATTARVRTCTEPPSVRAALVTGHGADGAILLAIDGDVKDLDAGMPVTAWLPTAAAELHGTDVPNSAIVRHLGQSFVFVRSSAEEPKATAHFELRAIANDQPTAIGMFTTTLQAGELLVDRGAAILLSKLLVGADEEPAAESDAGK
jgi:hypothetical protein